jgi:hypothetical protein
MPLTLCVTGAPAVTAGFCVHLGTGLASCRARPLARRPWNRHDHVRLTRYLPAFRTRSRVRGGEGGRPPFPARPEGASGAHGVIDDAAIPELSGIEAEQHLLHSDRCRGGRPSRFATRPRMRVPISNPATPGTPLYGRARWCSFRLVACFSPGLIIPGDRRCPALLAFLVRNGGAALVFRTRARDVSRPHGRAQRYLHSGHGSIITLESGQKIIGHHGAGSHVMAADSGPRVPGRRSATSPAAASAPSRVPPR